MNVTKNAYIKFNTLKISKIHATDQKTRIFSSFFKSQFTYCPSRQNILLVELIVYLEGQYALFNKTTLLFSKSKYLNGLSPDIMSDILKLRKNTYSLRNFHIFKSEKPGTKRFGLDSIGYRPTQLWINVPEEIRNSTSLPVFQEKIKNGFLISCSCNCCRKYIHHVRFI